MPSLLCHGSSSCSPSDRRLRTVSKHRGCLTSDGRTPLPTQRRSVRTESVASRRGQPRRLPGSEHRGVFVAVAPKDDSTRDDDPRCSQIPCVDQACGALEGQPVSAKSTPTGRTRAAGTRIRRRLTWTARPAHPNPSIAFLQRIPRVQARVAPSTPERQDRADRASSEVDQETRSGESPRPLEYDGRPVVDGFPTSGTAAEWRWPRDDPSPVNRHAVGRPSTRHAPA